MTFSQLIQSLGGEGLPRCGPSPPGLSGQSATILLAPTNGAPSSASPALSGTVPLAVGPPSPDACTFQKGRNSLGRWGWVGGGQRVLTESSQASPVQFLGPLVSSPQAFPSVSIPPQALPHSQVALTCLGLLEHCLLHLVLPCLRQHRGMTNSEPHLFAGLLFAVSPDTNIYVR